MSTFLGWMIPLVVFMVCPIWLPMLGWLAGRLRDLVVGDRTPRPARTHRPVREHRPDRVVAVQPEEA